MTTHSSAVVRETPHVNGTSRTNTIINALKQRAQSVLNDTSIDPESRAIIRYALETNDPWLADLVRRADAGETVVDSEGFLKTSSTDEEKIAALAELICRAGDEAEQNQPRCSSSCRHWKTRRIRKHSRIWRSNLLSLAALS